MHPRDSVISRHRTSRVRRLSGSLLHRLPILPQIIPLQRGRQAFVLLSPPGIHPERKEKHDRHDTGKGIAPTPLRSLEEEKTTQCKQKHPREQSQGNQKNPRRLRLIIQVQPPMQEPQPHEAHGQYRQPLILSPQIRTILKETYAARQK